MGINGGKCKLRYLRAVLATTRVTRMVQPRHRPTLSGRGGTLSAGRGRAVVVHSGRGAAGVKITLSERFEGNSRPSTSAPHSAGRAPARDVSRSAGGGRGRAGRPLSAASSRGRVRGAIRKSAAAPTVRGGRRAGVAPTVVRGGRPAAGVAPTVIRGGRNASGVAPGRVTGVAPGRVSARAECGTSLVFACSRSVPSPLGGRISLRQPLRHTKYTSPLSFRR